MNATPRRIALGTLALLLGSTLLACASSSPASPSAASPRHEETKHEETKKDEKPSHAPHSGPASGVESRKAGEAAYTSTYKPLPSQTVLLTNATLLTATGERIERGSVLMRDGKIAAVGAAVQAPADALVVDGSGKWVTPGIIDAHSHLGVYASPGVDANADGNEATDPDTAQVWAEHSVWPQDPQFPLALARRRDHHADPPRLGQPVRRPQRDGEERPRRQRLRHEVPRRPLRPQDGLRREPQARLRQQGARALHPHGQRRRLPRGLDQGQASTATTGPSTSASARPARSADPPERDLQLETLAGVLDGSILVQNHCYRADEMLTMIDIAKEFGYKVSAFHHAVEAYKIADVLAANDICADVWADWWGFKMEAFDGIRENAALVQKAGACVVIHSDSAEGTQRLNQEAAKAMAAGNRMGMNLHEEDVIRWLTINPAKSIGIDKQTGSLEAGKMADVVLWSGNPFSVYSRPEKVYIDGALVYDRNDPVPPARDRLRARHPRRQGVQP